MVYLYIHTDTTETVYGNLIEVLFAQQKPIAKFKTSISLSAYQYCLKSYSLNR